MKPIKLTEQMLKNGWRSHPDGMITRAPRHEKELFLSIEDERHGHNSCVLVVEENDGSFIRQIFKDVAEALACFALNRNIVIFCETLMEHGRIAPINYTLNQRGDIKSSVGIKAGA